MLVAHLFLTIFRDQDLVEQLIRGDSLAFDKLVSMYHGALLRLAKTITGDTSVAEEVVQDTWIAVIHGLRRFEGRASLKTWIFRILTYQARKRARRERRSIAWSALFSTDDDQPAVDPSRFNSSGHWITPPAPWFDSPEEKTIRADMVQHLSDALPTLPEAQQAVVSLRDVHGWTAQEVCDLLDITKSNQRVLLHRGRSRLRNILETFNREQSTA